MRTLCSCWSKLDAIALAVSVNTAEVVIFLVREKCKISNCFVVVLKILIKIDFLFKIRFKDCSGIGAYKELCMAMRSTHSHKSGTTNYLIIIFF